VGTSDGLSSQLARAVSHSNLRTLKASLVPINNERHERVYTIFYSLYTQQNHYTDLFPLQLPYCTQKPMHSSLTNQSIEVRLLLSVLTRLLPISSPLFFWTRILTWKTVLVSDFGKRSGFTNNCLVVSQSLWIYRSVRLVHVDVISHLWRPNEPTKLTRVHNENKRVQNHLEISSLSVF